MSMEVGFTKLMLFTLAANEVPLGPSHEETLLALELLHGNVFMEMVKNRGLVTFSGTSTG